MSTFYKEILAVQSPIDIGRDALNRTMFSFNLNAIAISPSDKFEREMAKAIHDAGLGVYSTTSPIPANTSIFIGTGSVIPDGAGPFIHIRTTGGTSPNQDHNNAREENLSCQVTVYATSYETGRKRAQDIMLSLDGRHNVTLTS